VFATRNTYHITFCRLTFLKISAEETVGL
jgi:hypothetical protein